MARLPEEGRLRDVRRLAKLGVVMARGRDRSQMACTRMSVRKAGYLHFKSLHQCGCTSLSELEVVADGWTDGPRRVGPWIRSRTPIAKLIDELKRRGICTPDTEKE